MFIQSRRTPHRPTLHARRRLAIAGTALAMSAQAHAQASAPWTPSVFGRHAIELLVDEGGLDLPVTQWPLPRAAVRHALDAMPRRLPEALEAARARVEAELREAGDAALSVTAREHADGLAGFGDDATPGSSVAVRSGELDGPHFAAQLGGRLAPEGDPSHPGTAGSLEGSAIATEALGLQLQAWSHRSWWSPGWQTSLPLSNNAPALNGIGLQRASASTSASPWLSWLGPWNVDFFVARSESELEQPANPLVSGTRLTIRPFPNLELGFTRMAQWGGAGRSESAKTFAKIMFGIHTNEDAGLRDRDPGNELAGYDVRLRCPAGWRCAGYGQWIGEDGAGVLPSKFLNLLGAELWSADGTQRVFVETADTHMRQSWPGPAVWGDAYRNYAYPGGFTSGKRWLGANIGPDSRLLTLGWIDAASDTSLRLSAGHVGSRIGAFEPPIRFAPTSGRLVALSARTSFAWGPATLTPELDWLRLHSPSGITADARIGLEMDVGLEKLSQAVPTRLGDALSGATSSPAVQAGAAAAIVAASVLLDHPADRYAANRRHDPASKALQVVGSDLPYAGLGLAGATWLAQRGTPLGDTALASVEAGLTSVALSEVLKQAVDRSRPSAGRGAGDFGHAQRSESSFPSTHAALAWSVVTPFAQQYDAPWLYGVAALTNLSRVLRREHWFSDTVAGGALGYVVGDWFHQRMGTGPGATQAQLLVAPHTVGMTMDFR